MVRARRIASLLLLSQNLRFFDERASRRGCVHRYNTTRPTDRDVHHISDWRTCRRDTRPSRSAPVVDLQPDAIRAIDDGLHDAVDDPAR